MCTEQHCRNVRFAEKKNMAGPTKPRHRYRSISVNAPDLRKKYKDPPPTWDNNGAFNSTIWDNGVAFIRNNDPRRRRPKEIPNLHENLKLVGDLRKQMEKSRLKEHMQYFKSKTLAWHEEFEASNDSSQILDLLVCHGAPVQAKTRHAHRKECFLTTEEIKALEAEAKIKKGQKASHKPIPKNTHTKALKTARTLKEDIAMGDDITPEPEENLGRLTGSPRRKALPRDASVFNGYNLNMTAQRHHPKQLLAEKPLARFKDIDYRPQETADVGTHVENRYLKEFNTFEDSKIWPLIRFTRHAGADKKIMRRISKEDEQQFMQMTI